jgi:hypothetical protein
MFNMDSAQADTSKAFFAKWDLSEAEKKRSPTEQDLAERIYEYNQHFNPSMKQIPSSIKIKS